MRRLLTIAMVIAMVAITASAALAWAGQTTTGTWEVPGGRTDLWVGEINPGGQNSNGIECGFLERPEARVFVRSSDSTTRWIGFDSATIRLAHLEGTFPAGTKRFKDKDLNHYVLFQVTPNWKVLDFGGTNEKVRLLAPVGEHAISVDAEVDTTSGTTQDKIDVLAQMRCKS